MPTALPPRVLFLHRSDANSTPACILRCTLTPSCAADVRVSSEEGGINSIAFGTGGESTTAIDVAVPVSSTQCGGRASVRCGMMPEGQLSEHSAPDILHMHRYTSASTRWSFVCICKFTYKHSQVHIMTRITKPHA